MTSTLIETNQDLDFLEITLDIAMASDSLMSLCRQAVLTPRLEGLIRGSHIFLLDQHINLLPTAFFGLALEDANPSVAFESIQGSRIAYSLETAQSPAMVSIPFIKNGVPEACCVLVLKPGAEITEIAPSIASLMGKVCGFFLGNQSNSPRSVQTFSGKPTIDELTGRQLQILDFMADGLTNVEISRKLLLSESTIRQESVRIYRTLETDNRQDAVSKGRAAGLIAKLPIHEAAIAS